MILETILVKQGQLDAFTNLFYAEEQDGGFQVAHSDKTFTESAVFQDSDTQAALNDLVAKLQALGWVQVVGTPPSPWYNLQFQLVTYPGNQNNVVVKSRPQDATQNLFYAQTLDGSIEVAHSDKTFVGNPDLETPDAKAALDDLVSKLQGLGWQQVSSHWYGLVFQRVNSENA